MKRIFTYCIALLTYVQALAAGGRPSVAGDTAKTKSFPERVLVYKGEKFVGANVIYANIDSKNSGMMLLLTGIDASGKIFRAAPHFNWAYRDNMSIGFRFAYGTGAVSIDNLKPGVFNVLAIDLGTIIPESLSLGNTRIRTYEAGVFHRNYFGLDKRGTVGLFLELRLAYSYNRLELGQDMCNVVNQFKLVAAPGFMLYILPFVSVEASIGLADLSYSTGRAYNGNVAGGRRQSFSAGVDFALFNCNMGISYHF